MEGFVLPRYGGGSLADLMPSIEAGLAGRDAPLPVPASSRYVILLVDGLGQQILADHAAHAEWMGEALAASATLTCGVPSTTATSLSSIGTGLPPAEHGIVGYTFLDPDADRIMNSLTWEGGPEDVESLRRAQTGYTRLGLQGHGCAAVTLGRFASSGLQQLSFAGTTLFAVEDEDDIGQFCTLVGQALEEHDVVYAYQRQLDHIGHSKGVGSWQWLDRLGAIDDLIQALITTLPRDVTLLVTGDHGMVNVPEEHRVVAETTPGLEGWQHLGGEGRFRQLYTDDPRDLALRWREVLGERAVVLERQDAIEAGWFGPAVREDIGARIGDVVVAMTGDWAVMSTTFPNEFTLVGMHGSLTPQEMLVPLLVHEG